MKSTKTILIVDDLIENIQIIQNCLEKIPVNEL